MPCPHCGGGNRQCEVLSPAKLCISRYCTSGGEIAIKGAEEGHEPIRRHHRANVERVNLVVLWSSPRWTKEYHVGTQTRCQCKEVTNDEFNAIRHTINLSVVSCHRDASRVNVNGDDVAAGEGELNCIATAWKLKVRQQQRAAECKFKPPVNASMIISQRQRSAI